MPQVKPLNTSMSSIALGAFFRGIQRQLISAAILFLLAFPSAAQQSRFDFASGNAAFDIVQNRAVAAIRRQYSPRASDASLILRAFVMLSNSFYDAIAPYHPTAVGVYSRLGRRPSSETADNTLMNVAMLHASHKVLLHLFPGQSERWDEMLRELGLDPDDLSEDLETAVGIGNAAGRAVVEGRANDGMNALGDESAELGVPQPFFDYTGYRPVNTAYELLDPSRWQPQIERINAGNYRIQHFVTPQYRLVEPYSFDDPAVFAVPDPVASNYANLDLYIAQARHVLETSLDLTDEQRMVAEFFDDKILSLGGSGFVSAAIAELGLFDAVVSNFFANVAAFDAGIVVWQEKTRYDAVRPFSAIRHLFLDSGVASPAGINAGTWTAYLPEADHPEYPSASACFCAAHSQFKRRFFDSDELEWSIVIPAGASLIQPGAVPAEDLTLSFQTWSDFELTCGQSRVWAGVHFQAAVDESLALCPVFGDLAYDYMQRLLDGDEPPRGPSRPLAQ